MKPLRPLSSEVRALSRILVGLVRTGPGCPPTAGASAASMPVHIGACYEQNAATDPGAVGQWLAAWLNQATSVEAGVRLGAVEMQQMASQGSSNGDPSSCRTGGGSTNSLLGSKLAWPSAAKAD
jgi:hypothetical protein